MKLRNSISIALLFALTGVYGQNADSAKSASSVPDTSRHSYTKIVLDSAILKNIYLAHSANAADTSRHPYDKAIADAFIGFGFVLGNSNAGAQINYGESREFIVGIGTGYRFVKWNGIGVDIYYKSTGFFLAQDSGKILPDYTLHKAEKISFDNFGGLVYDRFYISRFFFDGGFYYDWAFYTKHITWDNYSFSYGKITKLVEKQLDFTNPANYGLTFRIGATDGVSLYFNYRLTDVFKSISPGGVSYPELPVYVLGIVIGGHEKDF